MLNLIYVTSNRDKFNKAKINLEPFGIHLIKETLDIDEPQSTDGKAIAIHKAKAAFKKLQQPLLVNDDSWSIPALNGFPGTNMKQCNHFLKAEDWLRLLHGVIDRRVFLISYYAYHNGQDVKIITHQDERYFLDKPQGSLPTSSCLEVIARKGSSKSIAQIIAEGRKVDPNQAEFWADFAKVLLS